MVIVAFSLICNLSIGSNLPAKKVESSSSFNSGAERRTDFRRHRDKLEKYDENRVSGLSAYLDGVTAWEKSRLKNIKEFRTEKKNKVEVSQQARFQSYREHQKKDEKWNEEQSKARQKYLQFKRSERLASEGDIDNNFKARKKWTQFEMEELDLFQNRPRYDVKTRIARSTKGSSEKPGNTGNGGFPGPSNPNPNFDEFGDPGFNNGNVDNYFPPPPGLEDGGGFDDLPPPPPPPPPGGFDGMGDFPPPPPPPSEYDNGIDF